METVPDHDLEPPDIDLPESYGDEDKEEDVAPDGRDWMDVAKESMHGNP